MAQRRHVWYSPWLLKSQAIVSPVENSSPTVQALYEHGALRASPTFWVSWRPPTDSLARLGATGAFFEKHRQHTTPTQRPSHPGNCCALNFTMLSCWLSFGRFGQTKLLRESSSVFFCYRPITYHPLSVPFSIHQWYLPCYNQWSGNISGHDIQELFGWRSLSKGVKWGWWGVGASSPSIPTKVGTKSRWKVHEVWLERDGNALLLIRIWRRMMEKFAIGEKPKDYFEAYYLDCRMNPSVLLAWS